MTTNLESPRPKLLKDFLQDTNNNITTLTNRVCYPVHEEEGKMHAALSTSAMDNTNKEVVSECVNLPRSRSKSRGAAEALGKLLNNTIKAFHASTPLTLQRSVSRRLLSFGTLSKKWSFSKKRDGNSKSKCCSNEVTNTSTIIVVNVKVKDILRWRSFRDLVSNNSNEVVDDVEEVEPLDFDVGSSDDAPMVKSDDEEDFVTVTEVDEELKWDEVCDVGVASDAYVGPKKDNQDMAIEEEIEQQSPVSVLESPFRDEVSDEEFLSSFDQSLANMERTKQRLLQSLQMFESLAGVHEDYDLDEEESELREEESELREEENTNEANKSKVDLCRGFSWFKRGVKGLEEKKECINVMEDQIHWGEFQDERVEIGVDLEVEVLNDLLDEVLIDLCC